MLHGSLAYAKANGERLFLHCETPQPPGQPPCNHSAELPWDPLIERFGPDFIITKDRARFLRAFRCSKCGGKNLGLIMLPSKEAQKGGGVGPTVW